MEEDNINNILCPICNQNVNIIDYFFHMRIDHPLLLTTMAAIMIPDINEDELIDIVYYNDNNYNNNINYNYNYNNDNNYTYENLSELCEQLGNVNIGITDIDNVSTPTIYIDDIKNKDDNKCSICLDNFEIIQNNSDNYIRKINICKHKFCNTCISTWLSKHKTCPICKIDLSEVEPENIATNL